MTRLFRNLILFVGYAALTGCPASQPADSGSEPQAGEQAPQSSGGTQAAGTTSAAGGSSATPPRAGSGSRPNSGNHAGSGGKGEDDADAGPHAGGAGSAAMGGSSAHAGAAGSGSKPACDAMCNAGEHCELQQVQCVRAPCPPIAKCVADTAGSARCGSRGSSPCPTDQFCDFPAGSQCGAADAGGTCKAKPQACTQQYDPVCGCDGQTYGNACSAASAGVSVADAGECNGSSSMPPSGQVSCDPRKVLCKRGTPKCAGGSVPSVVGSCYGDCVPVEQCACDSPDACPQHDEYTCLMSAMHCTPYL